MHSASPKIYLDTNVFIEAFEKANASESGIWPVFDAVDRQEFHAFTSEITLAELLPKVIANGQATLSALYQRMFREQDVFEAVPVHQTILIESAQLRAVQPSLRLPDAVHLATAAATGCSVVLSNDRRLSSAGSIPTVNVSADMLSRIRFLVQ